MSRGWSWTTVAEVALLTWVLGLLQPPNVGPNGERISSLKLILKSITGREYVPVIFGSILVYFLAFTTCYLLQRFAKRVVPRKFYPYAADFFFTMVVCVYPYSHGTVRSLYGHVGYILTSVPLSTFTGYFFEGTCSPISVFHRYLRKKETLGSCIAKTVIQTMAAFLSFQLVYAIWSLEITKKHRQQLHETECETDLNINWVNGFMIEFAAVVADTWVSEHRLIKNSIFDTAVKNAFGALLVCYGVHITGMYMHPAMASGMSWNCQGTYFLTHIMVYWVSAFLGLLVGLELNERWYMPNLILEDTFVQPVKNIMQPVMDNVVQPVVDNVVQPMICCVVQPVVDNIVQPVVDSILQPTEENIVHPVIDDMVDNVITPAVDTMVDNVLQPMVYIVLQPTVNSGVKNVIQPVVETVVKPMVDNVENVAQCPVVDSGVHTGTLSSSKPVEATESTNKDNMTDEGLGDDGSGNQLMDSKVSCQSRPKASGVFPEMAEGEKLIKGAFSLANLEHTLLKSVSVKSCAIGKTSEHHFGDVEELEREKDRTSVEAERVELETCCEAVMKDGTEDGCEIFLKEGGIGCYT